MSFEPAEEGGDAAAATTWDRHAGSYPRQERLEARAIQAALRLADPGPGDRLVDVATGTGALLRALASRDRRPGVAIGVDRSRGMLARAGRMPQGWRLVEADARSLPVDDGGADVVTCSYLLHLLDPQDRARVLSEVRRVLGDSPGGRLVTVTVWADPAKPGSRALGRLMRRLAIFGPRRFGGLMPLDPTAELEAAGLAVTHRVVVPRGGYPSLVLRARPA